MTRLWPFSLSLVALACFSPSAIAQTIIPAQDGTATLVMPNGNTFNISGGTLSGDGRNLFHSFQEFGLSAQQIANFLANPQLQNILGRVTGGNPSIINGLIQVTGGSPNLFLMNPSGIVFGPNASLNVPASFAATTSTAIGFSGGQFNAYGENNYQALVGNPNSFVFQGVNPGAIINVGNLAVNAGQDISLVGGMVINTGKISAPGGEITLSAVPGSSLVRISQTGQILSLEVPVPQDAQGNTLPFKPTDLPTLLTTSGVNTGLTVTPTGTVAIAATGTPIPTSAGTNILSGQISTANAQGLGGKIQATGTQVGLVNATLNASGQTGGGTVLIGGDYQGKGTLPNAQNTYVSEDSVIQANALTQGNGGKVIVWADGNTQFGGSIEAKGGVNGGDGGFAEVSGKQNLAFRGNVNLTATQGKMGNLLLDPENITVIDGSGGANDSSLPVIPFTESPGANYTISSFALQALAGDTNIQLEAANNITIDSLTSTGGFLSFQPGTGTITFIANADNVGGGDFSMDTTNTISTAGRSLTIKGNNITVGGIQSGFSSVGGNVTLQGTGNVQANGSISTDGGSFTASGNNVAINNSVQTANFFTGTGGNVDLTGTNITVTPSSSAFSPAIQTGGGNVNATATGNLTINPNPSEATLNTIDSSNFSTGTGGTVTLNAGGTNQIAGIVLTGGGNFTATGGEVVITNSVQTSNFSAGTGGNVNLTGTNINITPSSSSFAPAIQTGGGNVNATANNNLTINPLATTGIGTIDTSNFSAGTGGAITLNAGGTNQIAGQVSTGGGIFTATGGELLLANSVQTSNFFTGATGGDVNLTGTNITVTPSSASFLPSIQTGGGNINVTATNNLIINPASSTSYRVNTIDTSNYYSLTGMGGTVNLSAGATNQIGGYVYTGGGNFNATGGTINAPADSVINTTGFSSSSRGSGMKGGNMNFQSPGNIQLAGTLETNGGNFTANGANLTIAEVDTSTGSDGLDGGAITLTATGNIQTGNLFSYTIANRGDVFSRGGDISLNAGGTIDATTGRGITIVQDASSSLQVPVIASGSSTGNGGNVSLVAGGNIKAPFIGTGSLSSGTAGSINITSQNGAIDATQTLSWNGESQIFGGLVSASVYGNGGNVTLSAPGNIQTGVIATGNIGGPVTPGNVTITSQNGSIDTAIGANINTVSAEFLASLGVPNQYLAEASQIQVGLGIFTFSKDTGGGNVTLNAKGDITTSNIITGSLNGNGGKITLNSQEGAINASSGILFQGLNATTLEQIGASANLAKLGAYLSDNKIGGLISFSVYGRGGDISLTAPQGITTNYLVSSSYTQQGGNISLNSTNGGIKISGLLTNPLNPLTFDNASDTLSLSDWNAIGWLFSQGSLSTRGGTNGGNITLLANEDIEAVTVNAQGGEQGGVVEIRTPQSLRVTGTFRDRNNTLSSISTAASPGRGGSITIQVGNYPFIVGDASRNGTAGAITSGDFTISSGEFYFTTQEGNIFLLLQDRPTPPEPPEPPTPPEPPIPDLPLAAQLNAVLQTPSLRPNVLPPLALASQGLTISTIPQVQDVLSQIAEQTGKKPALVYASFITPNTTPLPFDSQRFQQRELALASEYQTFITPTLAQVSPTLAVPPRPNYQLQLTVLIPGQEPYQIVVPDATRDKILARARPLQRQLANQQDTYLDNASQLYQWLIAPIEKQLTTEKIDNVLFFLPSGLRTLPLAALYDQSTQQFVVEKPFTLGTAPSLNLVDYRYRNLNQAPVLAFGATDFPAQNQTPLPGVGVELPLIQSIKGGDYFLNQSFNLANVETQRRENPLPIVHLATHAKFVAAAPRQSYIQLFDQRLVLPSWQDLALNLPKTDLLVISACESAVGNEEVELGFGGMAVQVGVKTAVASLWPVGDIGTVGLMDGFYRGLKVTQTKAEALQQAQRALLKGDYRWSGNQLITPNTTIEFSTAEAQVGQNLNLRHPYYWSSFMMIGSPW